jgi:hypothetical protein
MEGDGSFSKKYPSVITRSTKKTNNQIKRSPKKK